MVWDSQLLPDFREKGWGKSRKPYDIVFMLSMVVFCYNKGTNTLSFDCILCPAYPCSRNPVAKCPRSGIRDQWDCPFTGIALFPKFLQLISSFISSAGPYLSAFCAVLSTPLPKGTDKCTFSEFFSLFCSPLWALLDFPDLFLCPLCPVMIISAFQTPCKEQKRSISSQVLQQITFFFLPTLIHLGQVWFFYL